MRPPEPCQKPFTPCWCETRPNNPHCETEALSIESNILSFILAIGIFIYMLYIFKVRLNKPKVKITASEVEKLNQIFNEVNQK